MTRDDLAEVIADARSCAATLRQREKADKVFALTAATHLDRVCAALEELDAALEPEQLELAV